MAIIALNNADLFVDGVELSAFAQMFQNTFDVVELDKTTFASGGWHEGLCAIRSSEFDVKGPQDFATSTAAQTSFPDETLWPALGTVQTFSAVPQGGTEGNVALLGQGVLVHYSPFEGQVGNLAEYAPKWKSTDRVARGVLATMATVTTTGTGTVTSALGAVASGQKICASLHVLTVSGTTPSITVKVQSAPTVGFAAPVDRITFNAATGKGGQFSSLAGPVTDAFWRASWTVSGTTPSFAIRVCLGII